MPRFIRVFRCPDCNHKWKAESKLGFPEPDCPQCGFHPDPLPDRVCAPAIVGTRSKAVDQAWSIAQEDFGLTNMRDNTKEGETSIIMPPAPPANTIAPNNRVQQSGGFMWGGIPDAPKGKAPSQATAKGAAALANAEGRNAMKLLHEARPVLNAHSLGRYNERPR